MEKVNEYIKVTIFMYSVPNFKLFMLLAFSCFSIPFPYIHLIGAGKPNLAI